jgi:hypothetical protein
VYVEISCLIFNKQSFFQKDDTGKMLYTRICDSMRLEEKDYFGLMFYDNDKNKVRIDF